MFGQMAKLCDKDFPGKYSDSIGWLRFGLQARWLKDSYTPGPADSIQQIDNKVACAKHFYDGSPLADQLPQCKAGSEPPRNRNGVTKVDLSSWKWLPIYNQGDLTK